MTLVLQIAAGLTPETDDAIKKILSSGGLTRQATSKSNGADTFYYYRREGEHDVGPIIKALMRLPGVVSAYVKPEGVPPL